MSREISTPGSTPRLRVLYCTDTYLPQVNGVSVVASLTVAGLAERGWESAVVAPAYPGQDGLPSRNSPIRPAFLTSLPSASLPIYPDIRLVLPDYRRVARAIKAFGPDLVHCQTEFLIGRLGQLAAARAGIPVVSSYHTNFATYAAAYGVPWLRSLVASYLGRFHRRSRRTYTPSAAAKAELAGMGVRNVDVWGRAVDTAAFHPSHRSEELREAYGMQSACCFLHVGRLAPEKSVDRLIEAFAILRTLVPEDSVHLVIAGSGPREQALRSVAPDGVTFLGNLDRERALPRLYASCDAFLFSSLTETLGLVVLEAMASGLPVIAAPAGGVADHLRHGENGLAYPPQDVRAMAEAMAGVVRDRSLRRRLALGARATAESLSWSAELDRLDRSYRDLLRETRAGIAA